MRKRLIFRTIEGRISELKGRFEEQTKNLDLVSLSNDELLEQGRKGIFWSKTFQKNWLVVAKERSYQFYQIIKILKFILLCDLKDRIYLSFWKNCIEPKSRLRSITLEEFNIILLFYSYLLKMKLTPQDKEIENLLKKNPYHETNIIQLSDKAKIIINLSSLTNIEKLSEDELFYIITADKNELAIDKFEHNNNLDIFFHLSQKLSLNREFKLLTSDDVLIASLFYKMNFANVNAVATKFEQDLAVQVSVKDVPPKIRSIPLLCFLIITIFEFIRSFYFPNSGLLITPLVIIYFYLLTILIELSITGEFTLENKIIEIIKRQGNNNRRN